MIEKRSKMRQRVLDISKSRFSERLLIKNQERMGKVVDLRPVHFGFDSILGGLGTANGSSLVTIGNTKVMCGVVATISEVKPGEKLLDFIKISVEFPHVNTQQLKNNQISEPSQIANNMMENIFKRSKCIRTEDLISCNGKMYQTLTCELVCLDYDGRLYDACCLALMAALMNTSLEVYDPIENTSEDELEQVTYQLTTETKKLNLNTKFFATTFALWNKDVVLFDPTKEEEDYSKGTMTIVCLENSREYFIHKTGGPGLTDEQFKNCLKESNKRVDQLLTIINNKFDINDR